MKLTVLRVIAIFSFVFLTVSANAGSSVPLSQPSIAEQRYYGVPDNNGDGVADEKDYFDISPEMMKEMFPDPETYSLSKTTSISETSPEYYDAMNHIFCQPNINNNLSWYGSGDVNEDNKIDWKDYTAMQQGVQNDMADVDGDGIPSTTSDLNNLEDYLTGEIPYLQSHFDSFQDVSDMHSWNTKIWEIDQLDTNKWIIYDYISKDFAIDTYTRQIGLPDTSDIYIPDKYDLSMNAKFNQPVYFAGISNSSGWGHGMNVEFKGIVKNDSLSFENCYFIDPQDDELDVQPGDWNIPYGTRITICGIEGFKSNGGVDLYPIAAFQDDDDNGTFELYYQNPDLVFERPVSIKTSSSIPTSIYLTQNFPNPFNSQTTIRYYVPQPDHVIIKLYDICGREIKTLTSKTETAGDHTIRFDASRLASGIYFCTLKTEKGYAGTIKLVQIR